MSSQAQRAAPRQKSSLARLFCCGSADVEDGASVQPSAISSASANAVLDMTLAQKDALFRYQLDEPDPKLLGPLAFYVVGIAGSHQDSFRIQHSLKQFGILAMHGDSAVYTSRITRQLTKKLPFLARNAQRLLIALLFFWEEELERWVQIEQEANEVEKDMQEIEREGKRDSSPDHIEHEGDRPMRVEDLTAARTRLQTLWSIAPSMRDRKSDPRKGSVSSSTLSGQRTSQSRASHH